MTSMKRMNLLLFLKVTLVITSTSSKGMKFRIPSFLIDSSELSASSCLNGGTSISMPYLHGRRHVICICPRGFSGRSCETEERASCIRGNGHDYRGTVAMSRSGHICLAWQYAQSREAFGIHAIALGLWGHNYCRNPDRRERPWCYVRRGLQITQEFCNIPHCGVVPERSTCGQKSQSIMRVVGGKVTTVESQPWVTAIFWRHRSGQYAFLCGGSLISSCWVLTAAHCFPENPESIIDRLRVVLGKDALNETHQGKEQRFSVEQIIVHPGFDDGNGSYDNDIALLKISTKGGACAKESGSVRSVCLPPDHHNLQPGVSCFIAGYGKELEGMWHNSQYLREGKVNILSQDVCRSPGYYGDMVTENMICAGSPDWTVDSCKGDSGGPLVCEVDSRYHLFGIVSWGDGCSREFRPGVYTRVASYNKWISEQTGLPSGSVL